jgi:hypothetical protein
MNFQNFSDEILERETKSTVAYLKKGEMRLLHLLAEIERRRLYSKNHSSLFEYCVKFLKLSGGSAQRRIDTMRAMKLLPEIEEKILSGDLNLMAVSQAQSFFRQESKLGKKYSVTQKKEVLARLENKSTRECAQVLVEISPLSVPREKLRDLNKEEAELTIVVDREFLELMQELKEKYSHIDPSMKRMDILKRAMKEALRKPKPRKILLPALEVKPRHIPAAVKREVRARDKNTCTHPGCKSKHQPEFDHIIPISMGGKSTTENLRMLCKAHNQRAAIEKLGFYKMNTYINV